MSLQRWLVYCKANVYGVIDRLYVYNYSIYSTNVTICLYILKCAFVNNMSFTRQIWLFFNFFSMPHYLNHALTVYKANINLFKNASSCIFLCFLLHIADNNASAPAKVQQKINNLKTSHATATMCLVPPRTTPRVTPRAEYLACPYICAWNSKSQKEYVEV